MIILLNRFVFFEMIKIKFEKEKHGTFLLLVLTLVLQCHLIGVIFSITGRRDHFVKGVLSEPDNQDGNSERNA